MFEIQLFDEAGLKQFSTSIALRELDKVIIVSATEQQMDKLSSVVLWPKRIVQAKITGKIL